MLTKVPLLPLAAACGALLAWVAPASSAMASDEVDVVIVDDDDDDDDDDEVIEITETTHHHVRHHRHWAGLQFGTILTPYKVRPGIRPRKRVTSDQARACLAPTEQRFCGNVRGFDARVNFFSAGGTWRGPRFVGYFRSGYTTGRLDFEPRDVESGYAQGEARSLSYLTVPLFLGGNVYLFKNSPVRPFGGFGFGLDVLKMQYGRHDARAKLDTSARIGFELHGGVEARISNYVAVSAEVRQLWSARRRLKGLPDFSNQGLTFVVGLSVNFPTWGHHTRRHKHTVRRVKKVEKRPDVRVEVHKAEPEPALPPESAPVEPAAEVVAEPPPPVAPPPAAAPPPPAQPDPPAMAPAPQG